MHRWGNKKDMTGDDPPYLTVGTDVSAKYKGAFCEAKIRNVVKSVKCKIQYKNEQGSAFVYDEQIRGLLMPGASVEVKVPDKKEAIEGTIVKIQDLSQYTVVFDDGDIATLRRTALCLKSGRHFAESDTLDQLPLTHPEHFSSPVVSGARGSRRRDDMDESDDEEKQPKIEREEDMGKVVCVEIGDKKKSKDNWFPGLVVAPNAQDSVKIDVEEEYLVRSFKDGRYYTVPKNETTDFTRDMGAKIENITLKQAVEKAISFLDKNDLPAHWDREQLFRQGESCSDTDASDTDSLDDEPREEKDHFVAQLYKFMDDRGTPINKGPIITSKDVDLYKFFKIVYKFGGYNRVTNRNQWKNVTQKLGFTTSQTSNVKTAYKKYLHSFEEFYRKLGCTLLPRTDNKLRSRSSRPLIRDRDRSASDKIVLDKDENSSSADEDSLNVKESVIRTKSVESPASVEEGNNSKCSSDLRKETNIKLKTRDPSTESITDKKIESNTTNDIEALQSSIKDIKEEKLSIEKRAERKSLKLTAKLDETAGKKADKTLLKATKSGKKSKPVEKRIKKTESALSQMKEKRTLKERMKAIVQKLKLKSADACDQKKKKQKPAEDLNKFLSQGLRIKLKDEFASGGIKSRKLSTGSNESKTISLGPNNDKKNVGALISTSSNVTESNLMNSASVSKVKKSDEEGNENFKRKSTSRKRKDDDKLTNSSSESQMYEAVEFVPYYKTICVGDKLKVYYECTKESKVTYEAKVMNKRIDPKKGAQYLVHYTGWNTRYDEWIKRSRIADDLSWTPARAKRKSNQLDASPGSQTSTLEKVETQSASNQTASKTEKSKRASLSPVVKNRSKVSIKSGIKQMKNIKSKFESKSKKISVQKAVSENGSESENESQQKQKELQKTRSRTEKQKQQEEESVSAKDVGKDSEVKKKTLSTLKRTRSGSIKLEDKDSTKKRKLSPSTATKSSKSGAIRNSIVKSLVPRKRGSARTKESKDETNAGETSPRSNETDDSKIEEIEEESLSEDVKAIDKDLEGNFPKSIEGKNVDDKTFVLKITPVQSHKMETHELDAIQPKVTSEEVEPPAIATTVNEEEACIIPKKEMLNEEEMAAARIVTTQSFADSYLAENLEVKSPKIVKTKTKRDSEEKSISPSKTTNRSPVEKVAKSAGEVKEKTIFISRSPCEKKNEKTPEKDGKLRNVNTFTSYLNMDKIDLIKKGSPSEKNEKLEKSVTPTKTADTMHMKSVDDIYEFNEPEPAAIDERAILHRRTCPRIFEDHNVKRTKLVSSAVESIKDIDESSELLDSENGVETKAIPVKEGRSAVETKEDVEMRLTSPSSEKDDTEEHTSDEETGNEEISKADITLESVKSIILQNSPADCRMRESPTFILSKSGNVEDPCSGKSDDEDGDDSKLVISETDLAVEPEEVAKETVTDKISADDSVSERTDMKLLAVKLKDEFEPDDASENEFSDEDVCRTVTKKTNPEDGLETVLKKSSSQPYTESHIEKSSNKESPIHFSSQEDVINEIEVEVSVSGRKDRSNVVKKNEVCENLEGEDNYLKTKYEEEVNDGLLLCKETIPKSPETKDANDSDNNYSCALRVLSMEGKKAIDPQLARVKKESRSTLFASSNDTPPTTPEGSNSTPGTSPSEEVSGFSSATFSLNEKSGSNKDSSENETSSDASEKPTKVKKYSNEVYAKKNAYEFDTYLKNQAEQSGDLRSEEPVKKKSKTFSDTPGSGTDKDDSNDVSSSTPNEGDSQKPKSSIAYILAQIPLTFDSNQRIEFLEQKQEEIRKKYMHYKQEVATIDRKRKKLRRKQREGRMMTRNEANSLLS